MENEEFEIREDVRPSNISSAYVIAPFDVAMTELKKNGYRAISLEETARLGMDQKINDEDPRYHFVREGMLYIPNQGAYITKNSPIIDSPGEATQSHRERKEFYLTDEQVKRALENSLWIPSESEIRIPTVKIKFGPNREIKTDDFKKHHLTKLNIFGDSVLTNYIFGKEAKKYGDFLRNKDCGFFSVVNEHAQNPNTKKPFARPIIYIPFNEISDNPMNFDGGEPRFFLNGNDEFAEYVKEEFPDDTFETEYFPVRGIKEVN